MNETDTAFTGILQAAVYASKAKYVCVIDQKNNTALFHSHINGAMRHLSEAVEKLNPNMTLAASLLDSCKMKLVVARTPDRNIQECVEALRCCVAVLINLATTFQ